MRSKEEIVKEISLASDQGENEYLFLEVLIDIRDQLNLLTKASPKNSVDLPIPKIVGDD